MNTYNDYPQSTGILSIESAPQNLLRPEEAAKRLAISTRQLRDLTRAGSIKYINIGQRDRETRRYALADLDAFIMERTCQSSNAPARLLTRTISPIEVIDFQARRDARISERQKRSKNKEGKRQS